MQCAFGVGTRGQQALKCDRLASMRLEDGIPGSYVRCTSVDRCYW